MLPCAPHDNIHGIIIKKLNAKKLHAVKKVSFCQLVELKNHRTNQPCELIHTREIYFVQNLVVRNTVLAQENNIIIY